MTAMNHHQTHSHPTRNRRFDRLSAIVLFISIVAIALALVGIAERGTSPLVLLAPTLLGCWAIYGLRN